MGTRSGHLEINNARLAYEVSGDGPPLILIHGFTLDRRMWNAQIEALSAIAHVIRYDLRGFGESSLPDDQPYRHTGDLAALMDHLGIERADLMGLSLGGAVGIDFALAYPERVRSLILLDAVLNGFDWSDETQTRDRAVFQRAREAGIEAGKRAWQLHPLFEPLTMHTEAAIQFEQILADYSGWHFINRNPLVYENPPAAQRLAEISAPTLVVLGELDLLDFRRVADKLAEEIPGAQRVSLPDVGHLCNMEAPNEINRLVIDFLGTRP